MILHYEGESARKLSKIPISILHNRLQSSLRMLLNITKTLKITKLSQYLNFVDFIFWIGLFKKIWEDQVFWDFWKFRDSGRIPVVKVGAF